MTRARLAVGLPRPHLEQLGCSRWWSLLDTPDSHPPAVMASLGLPQDWLGYVLPMPSLGCTLAVPAGAYYDRSSIPQAAEWLIDRDQLGSVAPLFHDVGYRYAGSAPEGWVVPYRTFTRREVDDGFLELLILDGASRWRARAAWLAVRTFAGAAWRSPGSPGPG